MKSLFSYDNKFSEVIDKITNIIVLNFLCILFSIPIITIGPSVTATYFVSMKIVKNQEEYIYRSFIKSFKENFKNSTIVWGIIVLMLGIIGLDFYICNLITIDIINNIFRFILTMVGIVVVFNMTYIFPIMSKFENSIKNIIINSTLISIQNLPYTIIMTLFNLIPLISILFFYNYIGYIIFFYIVVGYALISCINSLFLNNILKKYINE